ncbi:MAG: fibronectin type III domain-containing protein [Elusimicrobiota bacterium]
MVSISNGSLTASGSGNITASTVTVTNSGILSLPGDLTTSSMTITSNGNLSVYGNLIINEGFNTYPKNLTNGTIALTNGRITTGGLFTWEPLTSQNSNNNSLTLDSFTLAISTAQTGQKLWVSNELAISNSSIITASSITVSNNFTITSSTVTAAYIKSVSSDVIVSASSFLTTNSRQKLEVYGRNITIAGTTNLDLTGKGYRGGYRDGWNSPYGAGDGESPIVDLSPIGSEGRGATGGGGGYGGYGGRGTASDGGISYGSLVAPLDFGSGGGGPNSSNPGGNGGGCLWLVATDTLTINGNLTANGGVGATNAGGGSGGSIFIQAGELKGSASIRADGGAYSGSGTGSGGGGGRIAILYTTKTFFTLSISTACGGSGSGGDSGNNNGGAGTIYLNKLGGGDAAFKEVIINNNNRNNPNPSLMTVFELDSLTITNYGKAYNSCSLTVSTISMNSPYGFLSVGGNLVITEQFDNYSKNLTNSSITLSNKNIVTTGLLTFQPITSQNNNNLELLNFILQSPSPLFISTLTITNSNLTISTITAINDITVKANSVLTTTRGQKLEIHGRNITVEGSITVSSCGYRGGGRDGNTNPIGENPFGTFNPDDGSGGSDSIYGGGGGYGGRGGNGNGGGATGGAKYGVGTSTQPNYSGSGGGRGNSGNALGGNGGGAIRIVATSTLTVNGSITASGQPGGTASFGGGGAGGSVWINAKNIEGGTNGAIWSNGGNGHSIGGGGGGRIALYCDGNWNFDINKSSVNGGTGVNNGEAGTRFFSAPAPNKPTGLKQTDKPYGSNISPWSYTSTSTVVSSFTITGQAYYFKFRIQISSNTTGIGADEPDWTKLSFDIISGTITKLQMGTTQYIWPELTQSATYWWRVKALNEPCEGDTPESDWATYYDYVVSGSSVAVFRFDNIKPESSITSIVPLVSSCVVYIIGSDNMALHDVTPFTVRYSSSFGFEYYSTTTSVSTTIIVDANGNGLIPLTTYYFKLKSKDMALNESYWSETSTKATLCVPPVANVSEVHITSITVVWAPTTPVTPLDIVYIVDVSSFTDFQYPVSSATTHSAMGATVGINPPLIPNTTYYVRVRARNYVGDDSITVLGSSVTLCSLPEPAWSKLFTTSATITWASTNPDNPGDTIYIIKLSTASDFAGDWADDRSSTTARSASSAIVSALSANTTYYGKVVAVNREGISATALFGSSATLCSLPNASWGNVTRSTATILWTASSPDDNPDDTTYIVQLSTFSNFSEYRSSETQRLMCSATFYDLMSNEIYWFRIIARNRDGVDTVFTHSESRFSGIQPPIGDGFDYITNTNIRAKWKINPDNNLSGIDYIVQRSTVGAFTYEQLIEATTTYLYYDFSGLEPNTTYWFRAQARNAVGELSIWAPLGSTVTYCSTPAGLVWSTISTNTIEVEWNPSLPPNPPNTIYIVQLSTASDFSETVFSSAAICVNQSAVISGLSPNTTYYGRVSAVNWDGIPALEGIPASTATLCNPPVFNNFTGITSTNIVVNWDRNNNQIDVTNYYVECSTLSVDNWTSVVSSTMTSQINWVATPLSPNTTHWFRARAINHNGIASGWMTVSTHTLCSVPAGLVWSTISTNTIEVEWNPSLPPNPPNTIYIVQLSTTANDFSNAKSSSVICNLQSAIVYSLYPNTTYYGRVSAVNWDGVPALEGIIPVSTATLCNPPVFSNFTGITSTTISVHWLPNNNPLDVTRYYIECSSVAADWTSAVSTATTSLFTIHYSLFPATMYWFRAQAINHNGVPSAEWMATVSTHTVPLAVTLSNPTTWTIDVTLNVDSYAVATTSYSIKFVDTVGGTTRYVQNDYSLGIGAVYQTTTTWGGATGGIVTVKGLSENVRYTVTDTAQTEQGITGESLPQSMFTLLNKPSGIMFTPSVNSCVVSVAQPPGYNSGSTGSEFTNEIGIDAGGSSKEKQTGVYWYSDTGLSENTRYGYRAKYYNGDNIPTVQTIIITTYTLVSPPTVVGIVATSNTNLTLTANTFNNVDIGLSGYSFDPITGSPSGANSSGWIKTNIYNDDGLLTNTTYNYTVKFRNSNGVETTPFTVTAGCTLAETPAKPEVTTISTSTVNFTFSSGLNPIDTEYSIKIASGVSDYYLKWPEYTLGSPISAAVYKTEIIWIDGFVPIKGLSPNVEYQISVNAKNFSGFSTAYGVQATTRTLAEIPGTPTLSNVCASSITIIIDPKNNSSETTYSIKCVFENTTSYVQTNGLLGTTTAWQTYTNLGGITGKSVIGLYANVLYNFAICARNDYNNNLTEYSDSAADVTKSVVPSISIVGTSTNTIQLDIDTKGLTTLTQYAIKEIQEGTTKYVQLNGLLGDTTDWQNYTSWGDTITVMGILPNRLQQVYLGIKNAAGGETMQDVGISTWTLSERPVISYYSVGYDSVTVVISANSNPPETKYLFKCIIDGTTFYLQTDHTPGDNSNVWQTTTTWQGIGQNFAVLISTPNLPVMVYMKSRNEIGIESDYSISISTQTRLLSPPLAPTVKACYSEIGVGPATDKDQYFLKITINSNNSKEYTDYAIEFMDAPNNYVKSNGLGRLNNIAKEFAKESIWHDNKNISSRDAAGNRLTQGHPYNYRIWAHSLITGEEIESPSGSAFMLQNVSTFTVIAQEVSDDFVRINWTNMMSNPGFAIAKYTVSRSTNDGISFDYVSTVSTTSTTFDDFSISGSSPAAPVITNTYTIGKTVNILWLQVSTPTPSVDCKYKVIGWDESGVYDVATSSASDAIAVTPVITGYKVYYPTINTPYNTTTSTGIIVSNRNFELNRGNTFWISALSSDGLESDKTSVNVYLPYSSGPLEVNKIDISSGVKQNNMFVGVPKKPEITVTFNKVVDSTTINQSTIYVRAIRDNKNNTISKIIATTLSVPTDADSGTFIKLNSELDLDYGYRYEIIISSATDLLGQSVSYTSNFESLYDLSIENKFVSETTTYIEIANPEQLSTDKGYLEVTENPQSVEIEQARSKLDFDKASVAAVDIDLYNEQGEQLKQFEKFITITIGYTDNDNDGFVDVDNVAVGVSPHKIKEDTLSIWHLDEERGAWMKLPSTIDKVRKVVTAKTKQLSAFALIGVLNYSVSDVKVLPVPWVPEDGKAITGTLEEGIQFTGLPIEGEILVYTIRGELVRKIEFDENNKNVKNEIVWNGKNQDGADVMSGVYLWLVQTVKDKKTGKLIIIR